jgi:hypothetical protein
VCCLVLFGLLCLEPLAHSDECRITFYPTPACAIRNYLLCSLKRTAHHSAFDENTDTTRQFHKKADTNEATWLSLYDAHSFHSALDRAPGAAAWFLAESGTNQNQAILENLSTTTSMLGTSFPRPPLYHNNNSNHTTVANTTCREHNRP